MNRVVKPEASPVDLASGTTVGFSIDRIHTTDDLVEKLGISIEASYGSGTFGGVSGRFNFAKTPPSGAGRDRR